MIVHVDPGDPTPVYEQLRAQIARMVAAGVLAEGARLPTIRQLAADLGVAKGTVAKAYESLLRDGIVQAAGRRGTIVAPVAALSEAERQTALYETAQSLVLRARQLGLSRAEALAAVDQAFTDLPSETPSATATAAGDSSRSS